MTDDPYTTSRQLCDEDGIVSHKPVAEPNVFDADLTYYKQLNNLRRHSGFEPYEGEPFTCTGSAHLAGEHIRCTSIAHCPPQFRPPMEPLVLTGAAAERAAEILVRRGAATYVTKDC
jgi:hypothetical protein